METNTDATTAPAVETTTICAFPASKLDEARALLAKAHGRLVKAAAKAGVPAPSAPTLVVERAYGLLRCNRCGRKGPEAGSWRNAPEGSIARKLGDIFACDPLGMAGGECEGTMRPVAVADVTVSVARPKLAGWEFLAVVEALVGGNLLRIVPGAVVADGELDAHRTGDAARCDHCGKARKRSETFVVRNEQGERKQVGRQCLADFLGGLSAADVIARMSWIPALRACGEEGDGGGFGGGRGCTAFDVVEVLAWTTSVVRAEGWVSRGAARDRDDVVATADRVAFLLTPPWDRFEARRWEEQRAALRPTTDDSAKAADAIAWAKSLTGASDYEKNLALVAAQPYVEGKLLGILCSAVAGYERAVGREVARKRAGECNATSTHVGEVGKRLDLELTVEKIIDLADNGYGESHVHLMRDAAGNVVKWCTGSVRLDVGRTYKVRGTVKGHDDYKGTKQTTLTRCKAE